MTHASISYRTSSAARLRDPCSSEPGAPQPPGLSVQMLRDSRAVRGALIGAMLSVPLWAVSLFALSWLVR